MSVSHKICFDPKSDQSGVGLESAVNSFHSSVATQMERNDDLLVKVKAFRRLKERSEVIEDAAQRISSRACSGGDIDLTEVAVDSSRNGFIPLNRQVRIAADLINGSFNKKKDFFRKDAKGELSAALLLRRLDLQRFNQTVNLPVGDLDDLGRAAKQKMLSYLRLVAQRYQSLAKLPLDDLPELLQTMLSTSLATNIVHMLQEEGLPHLNDDASAANVQDIMDRLADLEGDARDRYFKTSILQPLFRDVLIVRGEFKYPTFDYVYDLAMSYAEWKRALDRGASRSALQDRVTRSLTQDTFASGLLTLKEALVAGVQQQSVTALCDIQRATEQGEGCDYLAEENKVSMTAPFGSLLRVAKASDIYGLPVIVSDSVTSTARQVINVDDIRLAITLLARLSGIDIIREFSLEFMTRYPEWTGLIDFSYHDDLQAGDGEGLRAWISDRLVFDFMCNVLNDRHVTSVIDMLFAEQNRSDLQKVFSDAASISALAHRTLVELVTDFLMSAKASYEWSNSPIWKELDKVGMSIPDFPSDIFTYESVSCLTPSLPSVTMTNSKLYVTRFYQDEELATLSPLAQKILDSAKRLGLVGSMRSSFFLRREFTLPVPPIVDVMALMQENELEEHDKDTVFQNVTAEKFSNVKAGAVVMKTPFTVNVIDPVRDEAGETIEGDVMVSKPKRWFEVVFSDLPRVLQVPVNFLDTDSRLTPEDGLHVSRDTSLTLNPIAADYVYHIATASTELSFDGMTLNLPLTTDDLNLSIRQWSSPVEVKGVMEDVSVDDDSVTV